MGISVGNKIEMVLLDQVIRDDIDKRVYVSKIYDILAQDLLQIAMPIYEGKIVPLAVDEKFVACFYTDKGLLECDVMVTSRYKSGNLFFLEIRLLGEPNKLQRREFYRYNCIMDAKVREVSELEYATGVPENTDLPESELDWKPVKILDISGGGVRIASTLNLNQGTYVKINFLLSDSDGYTYYNIYSRMLRSESMQGKSNLFEQRLEFLNIQQDQRDRIVRFIFERERAARAKEVRKR